MPTKRVVAPQTLEALLAEYIKAKDFLEQKRSLEVAAYNERVLAQDAVQIIKDKLLEALEEDSP